MHILLCFRGLRDSWVVPGNEAIKLLIYVHCIFISIVLYALLRAYERFISSASSVNIDLYIYIVLKEILFF